MQKIVLVFWLLAVTLLTAESDFTDKFEKRSVFGKWIDIDKGKIIEINSHTKFSFERLDNDLIILRNGSQKNYLKRIGSAKTKIKGRIVLDVGGRSYLSAANTDVTLTHVKDSSITVTVKTNSRGYFTDASLPSGDYYLQAAKNAASLKVPVSLVQENESLGTFILTHQKSAVFKSKLSLDHTFVISNGKRYKAFVDLFNYGHDKGEVCYKASLDDKKLKELRFKARCQTIDAGKSIRVPLYVSFNPIAINSTVKELQLNMRDKSGRTLVESHPFTVYKNFFTLKIKTANKAMKGYVVLPGQEVKPIDISKGKVALPKLSDEEYKLILANTDPKQKTAYEVDVGAEDKLIRGGKKQRNIRRRGNRNSTFKLKQSIARYPDVGDIAVYAFSIPDAIVMREDDKTIRVRFSKKDRLGEEVKYKATISNTALASVSYKNGYLTVTPKPGKSGVTTITLKNEKRYGGSNKKLFTLYIKEVNNKPRIVSKPLKTALENRVYRYYLKGIDAETKYLKSSAVTLPSWLTFNKKRSLLSGKPQAKDIGKHTVVLRVSDGTYKVDQSFTITVIAEDKAPESQNAFFSVQEDSTLTGTLQAKVRQGQDLSFTLVEKPQNGTLRLQKSGNFTYKPKKDYYGNDSFKVKALSRGKSSEFVVSITIEGVNDAPEANNISASDIGSGPLEIDWMQDSQARDVDQDELTLHVDKAPQLGAIEITQEGKLIYMPHADTRGEEVVHLSISDGNGMSKSITLTLTGISRQLTPRVLQTGQKVIYHPFDDGVYQKSLVRTYEEDLAGKVIKDKVENLTWYVGSTAQKMSFKDASDYCEDLKVGIVTNWRLPTIKELVMLTDKGQTSPAIDPLFKNIKNDYYWSSTPYGKRDNHRWTVYMDYGNDYFSHEKHKHYAQCVREGTGFLHKSDLTPAMLAEALKQSEAVNESESRVEKKELKPQEKPSLFVRYKNQDLVWDKEHELVWDDRPKVETATWVGAIKICEQLKLYGRSDWRLPNFNELYTLTVYSDNNRSIPTIDAAFKNSKAKAYWTSTSGDNDHDRAWGISFKDGSDFSYDKTEQIYVRCVRDQ